MNKNQLTCGGIYEYQSSKDSEIIFVNVFEQANDIYVYFPPERKFILLSEVPNSAIFSKWI